MPKQIKHPFIGGNIVRFPGWRVVEGKWCKDGIAYDTPEEMFEDLPYADEAKTDIWTWLQHCQYHHGCNTSGSEGNAA